MHLVGKGTVSEAVREMGDKPVAAPWLVVTGQRWKFRLGFVASMASLGLFALAILEINGVPLSPRIQSPRSFIAAMTVGALAFAWLVLSVRCGQCGGYPTWFLMRSAPASRWVTILLAAPGCPACGRRPEQAGTHDS